MELTSFFDLVSFSTAFFPFIFLTKYYLEKDFIYIYALSGLLILNIFNERIKYSIFYNDVRPQGALNCNLFNNDGNQSGRPGMPSGHTSITTYFFLTYLYILYLKKNKIGLESLFMALYLSLVMYSRYYKRCHTIPQIAAGGLLGSLWFLLFYILIKSGLI